MRINTRFTVAVHMMAMIAIYQNGEYPITSELLAKSVGTNPVVIRQMMSALKKADLIVTQSGVAGCRLAKEKEEISLLEIYKAVQKDEDAPLFDFHPNPNQKCSIGANIEEALASPLEEAQAALEHSLAGHTLQEITKSIREKAHH